MSVRLPVRTAALLCALGFSFLTVADLSAAPSQRYKEDVNGDMMMFGNTMGRDCASGVPNPVVGTVGTCGSSTSDSGIDIYWRSDSPASGQAEADNGITAAQARSKAVFQMPAGAVVEYARLYWSAQGSTSSADLEVTLTSPDGANTTITADDSWTNTYDSSDFYQSTADVTALLKLKGQGAYTLSGMNMEGINGTTNHTSYGAWTIVVVYALASDPPRNITLFDGFDRVTDGVNANGTISGFLVPNAGYQAKLYLVAYEGDQSISGDSFRFNNVALSDDLNTSTNFFNGTRGNLGTAVTVVGDLPQLTGGTGSMGGVDMDVVDVTSRVGAGDTSATFSARSTGDLYYLGVFGLSISTVAPNYSTSTKTQEFLDPLPLTPGEKIKYTITATNTGNDTAPGRSSHRPATSRCRVRSW